jgi:hypothetical protein
MHLTLIAAFLASAGFAKQAEIMDRPVCTVAIHGQFWPSAANADAGVARKLAQCGALEVCTRSGWKYKWKPFSVNVRQLGKTPQEPTPACAATIAAYQGRDGSVSASH